jgi:hypothetical protein
LQTGAPFVGYVTPLPARLTATRQTNLVNLSITGAVGARYQLEYAPSLPAANWTPLTNTVFFSSPVLFQDVIANGGARFYRVVGSPY